MILLLFSVLLGLTTAEDLTHESRQLAFPQQPQASDNLWDRIDAKELEKQIAIWHTGSDTGTATKTERQGYPGAPGSEIPRPIPPIQQIPTAPQPPIVLPQGCLTARGQFPTATSCAHYLNCWDEVAVEQQCPGGLLFNDITSVCDFEWNTYCGNRPAPLPKPPLAPEAKICPDPNGRYRSSTNCSEFFVCVGGRPVKFNCPRGLVYNDELGVCDYTYRVDCHGSAVPAPWTPALVLPQEPLIPGTQYYPEVQQPQPPQYPETQPPQYPVQQPQWPQTQYPQPGEVATYPPYGYPANPWLNQVRIDPDPWHQRPAATEIELAQQKPQEHTEPPKEETANQIPQQDINQKPQFPNPWGQVQAIPAELTKVPCRDGDVHRLTDSCSSVVVCRKNRPQLVQCVSGQIYDKPTDSCRHFTVAKC